VIGGRGRLGNGGASGRSGLSGPGGRSGLLFAFIRVHSRLQLPGEVVGGDVHSVGQVEAVGFETLDTGVED
jgi:hypothetical protein